MSSRHTLRPTGDDRPIRFPAVLPAKNLGPAHPSGASIADDRAKSDLDVLVDTIEVSNEDLRWDVARGQAPRSQSEQHLVAAAALVGSSNVVC